MAITEQEIDLTMQWISSFGADPTGGITRLLYSQSWFDVQNALKEKFEEIGMEATFDAIGNLHGKLVGTEAESGTIATGSHIDTVVNGGNLDGQLGIFGAYLAIKDLQEEYGKPKKSLQIISMAEEEGSRFPYVFWGSKNLFGLAEQREVEELKDKDGVKFVDSMRQFGFEFRKEAGSCIPDVKAFIELHIEQGNTLETEKKSVGVVTGIVGQRRYNIRLVGEANHAGTTLMKYRKDVIQAYADIVYHSIKKAKAIGDPLVLTFGKVEVKPNTVNVVPGEALVTMDCRHTDREVLHNFTEELEQDMKRTAAEYGVEIEIDRWMDEDPVPMDDTMITLIQDVCTKHKLNYRMMHSGAGHDSQIIAPRIPTGIIFVPSVKGISHNPAERTELSDLKQGVEALKLALYELAYI